jgi:hypothetical protein
MPDIYHPVTGAGMAVSDEDAERFLKDGWVDATPYEFKDNSWEAVRKSNEEAAGLDTQQAQPEQPPAEQPQETPPQEGGTP